MRVDTEPGARFLRPKDHQQHLELQPKLKAGYTPIDGAYETNEYWDRVGAWWTPLSDPERKVRRDFDIKEHADPTLWGSPSDEDLWRDPMAPGPRENREEGDRSPRYPYGTDG